MKWTNILHLLQDLKTSISDKTNLKILFKPLHSFSHFPWNCKTASSINDNACVPNISFLYKILKKIFPRGFSAARHLIYFFRKSFEWLSVLSLLRLSFWLKRDLFRRYLIRRFPWECCTFQISIVSFHSTLGT